MRSESNRRWSEGTAVFSNCGRYRYLLTRRIGPGKGAEPRKCLFVMLNPSTADAEHDDPTIRRCIQFSEKWGMSELRVVNLFALRTSLPAELQRAADPVGPNNDGTIASELRIASLAVLAWGNHGTLRGRADNVSQMILDSSCPAAVLALNRTGEPRHPLYAPASSMPIPHTPVVGGGKPVLPC